jgi:hypothetical protein
MTEKEWMECADSEDLVANLPVAVSPRKWRLLSVACCRQVYHLLSHQSSKTALHVGESFADGELSVSQLHEAMEPAENAWADLFRRSRQMVDQSTEIPLGQFSQADLDRCDLSDGRDAITVLGEDYRRLEAQEDAAMAAVRCVVHDPDASAVAVACSTLRHVALALAIEELLATIGPKQDRMFLVLESIEWRTFFDRQRVISSANLSSIVRDIFGNPCQRLLGAGFGAREGVGHDGTRVDGLYRPYAHAGLSAGKGERQEVAIVRCCVLPEDLALAGRNPPDTDIRIVRRSIGQPRTVCGRHGRPIAGRDSHPSQRERPKLFRKLPAGSGGRLVGDFFASFYGGN